jgi:hypothetical protein
MATLTAARASANFPVAGHGFGGNLKIAWGTYTLAANPTAADIIRFCRLPAYATVVGGLFYGADIDTGTETLDIDIGWEDNGTDAADPDGFGNFGVLSGDVITELIPVAGIWRPLQGVLLTAGPKTFAAETIISGTVIAAAAATGTGVLSLNVYYTLE